MFDHLDDAHPLHADATIRRAVADRSRALRRQRLFVTAATALAVTIASVGVAFALTRPGPHHPLVVATEPPSTTTTTTPPGPALNCGLLLPPNAEGAHQTATATLDGVTATLEGTRTSQPSTTPELTGARLTLTEGTKTLRTDAVAAPNDTTVPLRRPVLPGPIEAGANDAGADGPPLCLARFAGSNRPVALLGLWTGGADCCSYIQAFTTTGEVPFEVHVEGRGVEDHPGGALINSGDYDFRCQFTSCAESGEPLRLLEVQGARFVDVTRQHIDLVTADAARLLGYAHNPVTGDSRGFLAAWAADECLVDGRAAVDATVDELNSQGKLNDPNGTAVWPQGSAYVTALDDFLSKHGYC